jgi:ComF family protein
VLGYANHGCKKRTHLDQLISICWYHGVVRSVITTYKYGNSVRGLEKWIQRIIIQSIEPDLFPQRSIVVPIPLHMSRLRQRGFNQSEFIAGVLASYSGLEVNTTLIARHKNTSPQSRIAATMDRKGNVKDAFEISLLLKETWSSTHIILVDDVVTSGSTLQSCARAIKKQLPGVQVTGFTFAKG